MDSDLSCGQRYPPFEQLGSGWREAMFELSALPKNKAKRKDPGQGLKPDGLIQMSSATSPIGAAILTGQMKCICGVEPWCFDPGTNTLIT